MDRFRQADGSYRTRADVVREFVASQKTDEPMTSFFLPDTGQPFGLTGGHIYTERGKGVPEFLSLCAVCEADYLIARTFDDLQRSPRLVLTCPAHRGKAPPSPRGAWLPGEQLRLAELAAATEQALKDEMRGVKGVIEEDVMAAYEILSLSRVPTDDEIIVQAVKLMPRGFGRDVRAWKAKRALASLKRRGLI